MLSATAAFARRFVTSRVTPAALASQRVGMSTSAAQYDYVVIGGGSGGIASARRAAGHGAKVALVEGQKLGGTCVNVGCVPKKVMVHATELREHLKLAKYYGFPEAKFDVDMAALKAARDAYVARLNGIYGRNLNNSNVDLLQGWGRLEGPGSVSVSMGDTGETKMLSAKHVLLAPGGKPFVPPVPGSDLAITSDGFFQLDKLPSKVVVVGGGYIGVELAGVLNALGSDVTLLLRGERPLPSFDETIATALQFAMSDSGVTVRCNSPLAGIEAAEEGATAMQGRKRVLFGDEGEQTEEADLVLFATGRVPRLDNLWADSAAPAMLESGHIEVDFQQRTSTQGLYAVGDATTAPALTPVAIAAGRLLSDRLFAGVDDAALDLSSIPTVVFSHPPLGTVGLSREQAQRIHGAERIVSLESGFTSLFYGLVPDTDHRPKTTIRVNFLLPEGVSTDGTTPVPAEAMANSRVVGLHVLGPGADEMIQGFAVAVKMGCTKRDLDSTIAIHPTSSEEVVTLQPWSPHFAKRA